MNKVIYSKGMGKLSLLELISRINYDNVGTKKSVPCYIVDDYAIIQSTIMCRDYSAQDKIIDTVNGLADNGVNVVRIYGYVSDESKIIDCGATAYCNCMYVMDRAPGAELYRGVTYKYGYTSPDNVVSLLEYMDMLREVPQEHYTKFVHDYMAILDSGIAVDPSKKGNFFYDKEKGFTFIDVRNENIESDHRFTARHIMSVIMPPSLTEELREDASLVKYHARGAAEILIKLDNALLANGYTREQIDLNFQEQRFEDGSYVGPVHCSGLESVAQARDILESDTIM